MKAKVIYLMVAAIGLSLGWMIGIGGPYWNGLPVTFVCAALAFAINWIVFIPAWLSRSERFFDLMGAATYVSVVACALALTGPPGVPGLVLATMVGVWALRLGTMLFTRINKAGEDVRFREIKHDFVRFLGTWTLQGLWVVMTSACAVVVLTNQDRLSFDVFFIIGAIMWVIGFAIEVIADQQKGRFRADPENQGRFITTGLWSWSQHPNYFGEILLWTGIAVIAFPHLAGWGWLALISPVFVWILLTRVSGIPMLDNVAEKRWGAGAEYIAYTSRTSKLVPAPPKNAHSGSSN